MKKLWRVLNIYTAMIIMMTVGAVVILFFDVRSFIVACITAVICASIAIVESLRVKRKLGAYVRTASEEIMNGKSRALIEAAVPVFVTSENDEIVWYNYSLEAAYPDAESMLSKTLSDIAGDDIHDRLEGTKQAELTLGNRIYRIYRIASYETGNGTAVYMLFDVTSYRKLKQEYQQSRPVIAIVDIDNFEEITRGIKDADAASLKSAIHNRIEKWAGETGGIVRRIYGDRYMMVLDERGAAKLSEDKFSILGTVKEFKIGDVFPTVSIGVGRQADSLAGCEELAVQALEMAQSRGGDQAAIKSADGEYKFYGGLSAATEKRTKARARVIASAVKELIKGSDNVVIMGHKYADLDCLGSAYGLYKLARSLDKEAFVIMDERTCLASQLYDRMRAMNSEFVAHTAEGIAGVISKRTLLLITDVHRASMTEAPELISKCGQTVIIDHHRRAVDYIEGAVIFYNETAASSASEMVTELREYINPKIVGQSEAEALLAGIMLDTRNFVMNAGVRTFEASAFLRGRGADPIQVKKLFSGSLSEYRQRSNITATTQIYGDVAIAVNTVNDENTRVATAQAADELLGIRNVAASFVLCRTDNGQINISARSLGSVNVQLIMEALGGGGHRNMAACQLTGVGFEEAMVMLREAIDEYRENNSSAKR